MQTVKKVLNTSVVLACDEAGREAILLGKGIGFGAKAGDRVADGVTDQVFLPALDPDSRALIDLLSSISSAYVLLAQEIINRAGTLAGGLDPHLLLALTDHLHFAVERERQGLRVQNGLAWEIRNYYPDEYRIGAEALPLIAARVGVQLPEDEAANIAFHLVNARNDTSTSFNALRAASLISEIVSIVTYALGHQFEHDELNHRRFITHLQFFADRVFGNKMVAKDGDFLYNLMATRYPEAIKSAEQIRRHMKVQYDIQLPDEEVGYLALHIERLRDREAFTSGHK